MGTLLSILLMAPQQGAGKSNPLTSLLPFLLIIVVIYFFMIRPQSKKAKQAKLFKEEIKRGDKIVTIGGLIGRIIDVKENEFIIEVGDVKLNIMKDAVSMESTNFINGTNAPKK
jgi:preprotein translocase subunit YajC